MAGAFTFLERFQAAIRYGHYDPKLGQASQGCTTTTSAAAACEANVYEVGLNAFVHKNEVKLQLGYSLFDWAGLPAQHQVIVVSQFTY